MALLNDQIVHTLQDDMESLFYVLLHCCFRWLPHSDTVESVTERINALFHESHYLRGRMLGGDAKLSLLNTRTYIRDMDWVNMSIQEWLNSVLDYRSPSNPSTPLRLREKWTNPKHLNEFWSGFLTSHTLEANDRIERDLPDSASDSESIALTADSSPAPSMNQNSYDALPPHQAREMQKSKLVDGPATRLRMRAVQPQGSSNKRTSSGPVPAPVKNTIKKRKTAARGRGRGTAPSSRRPGPRKEQSQG
ncbi:hypothetical protein A0H81_08679 [Grifola frondosa]|uniref:Uncharacterized protein n=1 Tax=Grifola frondosa TaxID=5627 RepID=A0A1C7M2P5_GRIFR|nr:hypothetical protein A0H81_08679 [Grifola frondosa]